MVTEGEDDMRNVNIAVQCWNCKRDFTVTCNEVHYNAWKDGELIQEVMSYLTAGERELLISNTCDDCWHKMFGEYDYEDEDD